MEEEHPQVQGIVPGPMELESLNVLMAEIFGDIEHVINGHPGYIDLDMLTDWQNRLDWAFPALADYRLGKLAPVSNYGTRR